MSLTRPSRNANTTDSMRPAWDGPMRQNRSSSTVETICRPNGTAHFNETRDSIASVVTPCLVTLFVAFPRSHSNSNDSACRYQYASQRMNWNWPCMTIQYTILQCIVKDGIPLSIYADRHSLFCIERESTRDSTRTVSYFTSPPL